MLSTSDTPETTPETLLERIQQRLPEHWTILDALSLAEQLTHEDKNLASREDEIIGSAVHLATGQFEPDGRDPGPGMRRLCGELMVLSFIGFSLPYAAGVYKAVVASIHLAIDILADFNLSSEFCALVAKRADEVGAYSLAILALGDLGIAFARAEMFLESIPLLSDAASRAARAKDFNSAARYNSELGRSAFMLGDLRKADDLWTTALPQARRSGDPDLEAQISANLKTLRELEK